MYYHKNKTRFVTNLVEKDIYDVYFSVFNGIDPDTREDRYLICKSRVDLRAYDFTYEQCLETYLKKNGYNSMLEFILSEDYPKARLVHLIAQTEYRPAVANIMAEVDTNGVAKWLLWKQRELRNQEF